MLLLILAEKLILFFFGWEGVGLSSYLLIKYWRWRNKANKAAIKAFLIKKLGDWSLMIAISIFVSFFNDLSFFSFLIFAKNNFLALLIAFFTIAAIAKSGQFGFHIWLPSSMEGPTPVSALLHAATMITAGIFLFFRLTFLLELSDYFFLFPFFFASFTTFLASFSALGENDIKKIIAFSTISQIGIMLIGIAISFYSFSFYHLFNHAFFKALLFLLSGAIINA
jgi:NADH:ubiquinone oxidoreductase subunit 5 (subunit L)/multisubunit Na+/H+ antiporter MnhA subunit